MNIAIGLLGWSVLSFHLHLGVQILMEMIFITIMDLMQQVFIFDPKNLILK